MSSLQWLDRPILEDPVALVAFEGWGDAGESASRAGAEFLNRNDAELIAVIDSDEHFDFQVRRPVIELDAVGIRSISWPRNEIYHIRDAERDLVVILGEEPHYRWKTFTTALGRCTDQPRDLPGSDDGCIHRTGSAHFARPPRWVCDSTGHPGHPRVDAFELRGPNWNRRRPQPRTRQLRHRRHFGLGGGPPLSVEPGVPARSRSAGHQSV